MTFALAQVLAFCGMAVALWDLLAHFRGRPAYNKH